MVGRRGSFLFPVACGDTISNTPIRLASFLSGDTGRLRVRPVDVEVVLPSGGPYSSLYWYNPPPQSHIMFAFDSILLSMCDLFIVDLCSRVCEKRACLIMSAGSDLHLQMRSVVWSTRP